MAQSRIVFQDQINQLRHDLLTMGTRVEEDLRKAIIAARTRDMELARSIRAGDHEVNTMQAALEDKSAILMVTQQPVAKDLRELVTVIKVVVELERIGDYAAHLAKTVMKVGERTQDDGILQALCNMAEKGTHMLEAALAAMLAHDEDLARSTASNDGEIDILHKAVVADILAKMRANPDDLEISARLLRTANFLERLGDHVKNICESVVYMVSGVHVELDS